MSLPLPNLDDRTFDDLINAARQRIAKTTQSQWTDLSPGDPGMVLLELYAYLTETMIYRLNRLPQKVYVALLNLLGVSLRPPSAAGVTVEFKIKEAAEKEVIVPGGTRVSCSSRADVSGKPVTFRTVQPLVIQAGETQAHILAYHFEQVEGELLGVSTGMPGSAFKIASPPVVDPPGDFENALFIGVEAGSNNPPAGMPAREFMGKTYQIWRQAASFTDLPAYAYLYMVDRMAGTVTFAPGQGWEYSVPPTRPAKGKKIRVWYWYSQPANPDQDSSQATNIAEVDGELFKLDASKPGIVVLRLLKEKLPVIGQTLSLAVEVDPGETVEPGAALRIVGNDRYRVWSEVSDLSQIHPSPYVYRLDRNQGLIYFASDHDIERASTQYEQRRAHIPPAGQEIRAWYWRGGGAAGNVPSGSLTTLLDTVPEVSLTVNNPWPASGGYDAETVEQALQRGPQELYLLPRGAITARDFERLALRSSPAIARAQALTQAELWKRARPGMVEVLLVPDLPEIPKEQRGSGQVTARALVNRETEDVLKDCHSSLTALRPLGTDCLVNWTSYKAVKVQARIFVHKEENAAAVRERVLRRLHEYINPLPTATSPGWVIGKPLQASDVYNIALAEPGVHWVDRVGLVVDEVPDRNVCALAADYFEPGTWYAGSESILFRSRNDGEGWEPTGRFPGETIRKVCPHPRLPGRVLVFTQIDKDGSYRLRVSDHYGENWNSDQVLTPLSENQSEMKEINDIAWGAEAQDSLPVYLATDSGLYKMNLLVKGEAASLVDLGPNVKSQNRPVYALAATNARTNWVAVATQDGVFISNGANFRRTKGWPGDKDVQKLAFQEIGNDIFLWAGTAAAGIEKGKGCLCLRLRAGIEKAEDETWSPYINDWNGGSCTGLAFFGAQVLAATHHYGVLWLNFDGYNEKLHWELPDIATCDLPPRDPGPFQPVAALATNWKPVNPSEEVVSADRTESMTIMASVVRDVEGRVVEGVYRYRNVNKKGLFTKEDMRYEFLSQHVFNERVTLPPTWLFVSEKHEVIVLNEGQEGM